MSRTVSEHVVPVNDAVTPRGDDGPPLPAGPGDGNGRPADDYVHPGMWVALWVWVVGFSALALQLVTEAGITVVRALLHR